MNQLDVQRGSLQLSAYGILWKAIAAIALGLSRWKPRIAEQLKERQWNSAQLEEWKAQRAKAKGCYVFFSSSAGEYEQAKPLIKRLHDHNVFVLIVFVSPSGTRFARSQKESTPYLLAPGDHPAIWHSLAEGLRPDAWIVVRYELWPGFLAVARRWAPVYLIDAVAQPHMGFAARLLRRKLLARVSRIFVVGSEDREFFRQELRVAEQKLQIAGDSKYDRVLERRWEREIQFQDLKKQLASFIQGARVFVLGSAWPDDLKAFMSIYETLKEREPNLKVILAPHDLSSANLEGMLAPLETYKVCRVSRDGFAAVTSEHDFLFVDMIGVLPELYGLGHLAWVGGAMHFRVHNVLEPACRGIYVCFGSRFETSQEAKALVAQGLAKVIATGEEFLDWYKNLTWDDSPPHQRLWQMVKEQQGASDRILTDIRRATLATQGKA